MSQMDLSEKRKADDLFRERLAARNQQGRVWGSFFYISNFIGLTVLIILLLHILNYTFGLVVVQNAVDPATLADRPLAELNETELVNVIVENQPGRLRVMIRDKLSQVPNDQFTLVPVRVAIAGSVYPAEYADALFDNNMPIEIQAQILSDNLGTADILDLILEQIIKPTVVQTWTFLQSIFDRADIEAEVAEKYPNDSLEFRAWLNLDFISSSISSSSTTAGLRTALLGSFWIISITAVVGLIIGVSAAIYLEEYATDNWLNRLIEINIRNLAAIPSVIYGMLGLAVFAQAIGVLTGGYLFGVNLPTQSEDQIVIAVQDALEQETLSGNARVTFTTEVSKLTGEDAISQYMIEAINTDVLTDEELINLFRLFHSYRLVSAANLSTFSNPPAEKVVNDLASVIAPDKLTVEGGAKLAAALQTYGTFNTNGRTVVSAALTLALLILPVIIVNAQEAIRAVPRSIREASYGLGATKWQTTSRQVLPAALPGILTGVILAVSRALGETAPLLVVGASTFIGIDPNGPFSKFTVVPIQIFQWTARPELEFRSVAAAAIIMLLVTMLLLNAVAIILRNRFTVRY
jgi:ABC-type phosphate transport system permease subunit